MVREATRRRKQQLVSWELPGMAHSIPLPQRGGSTGLYWDSSVGIGVTSNCLWEHVGSGPWGSPCSGGTIRRRQGLRGLLWGCGCCQVQHICFHLPQDEGRLEGGIWGFAELMISAARYPAPAAPCWQRGEIACDRFLGSALL